MSNTRVQASKKTENFRKGGKSSTQELSTACFSGDSLLKDLSKLHNLEAGLFYFSIQELYSSYAILDCLAQEYMGSWPTEKITDFSDIQEYLEKRKVKKIEISENSQGKIKKLFAYHYKGDLVADLKALRDFFDKNIIDDLVSTEIECSNISKQEFAKKIIIIQKLHLSLETVNKSIKKPEKHNKKRLDIIIDFFEGLMGKSNEFINFKPKDQIVSMLNPIKSGILSAPPKAFNAHGAFLSQAAISKIKNYTDELLSYLEDTDFLQEILKLYKQQSSSGRYAWVDNGDIIDSVYIMEFLMPKLKEKKSDLLKHINKSAIANLYSYYVRSADLKKKSSPEIKKEVNLGHILQYLDGLYNKINSHITLSISEKIILSRLMILFDSTNEKINFTLLKILENIEKENSLNLVTNSRISAYGSLLDQAIYKRALAIREQGLNNQEYIDLKDKLKEFAKLNVNEGLVERGPDFVSLGDFIEQQISSRLSSFARDMFKMFSYLESLDACLANLFQSTSLSADKNRTLKFERIAAGWVGYNLNSREMPVKLVSAEDVSGGFEKTRTFHLYNQSGLDESLKTHLPFSKNSGDDAKKLVKTTSGFLPRKTTHFLIFKEEKDSSPLLPSNNNGYKPQ